MKCSMWLPALARTIVARLQNQSVHGIDIQMVPPCATYVSLDIDKIRGDNGSAASIKLSALHAVCYILNTLSPLEVSRSLVAASLLKVIEAPTLLLPKSTLL